MVLRVSDRAPERDGGYRRDTDNSWTISTGGRSSPAAGGNSATYSTAAPERILRIREGEHVVLDLPSVQSMRFLVPAGESVVPGTNAAPAADSVLYFEAVSGFSARFRVDGRRVFVELSPILPGTVRAPYEPQAPAAGALPGAVAGAPVVVETELGHWKGLGGGDAVEGRLARAPPTGDSVWIRVDLE